MRSVTATFRNGRVELMKQVDWPHGIQVAVTPLTEPNDKDGNGLLQDWPDGFFDRLRDDWGDEPIERPAQGNSEPREDW